MGYLIGVDLGTTSTKAVLMTVEGKIIATSNKEYSLYRDEPDMAEQDLDEIWEAFISVMKEISNHAKDEKILAVSFSSAMHSLIAFDANWNSLTRIITWADTRAVEYTEKLKENDVGMQIYLKTGTPLHPMAPLSKIIWLRNEHKDIFDKTAHFLGIKEFLFHKIFGSNKIDISIASGTGLFNIFDLEWDKQALEVAGIKKEQLPTPVEPYEIERNIPKHYAEMMGLSEDVPFVYGGADGPMSNLGVDAIRPGTAAITIGTSGAIRVGTDKPKVDPKGRTFTYAIDKDHWVIGGPVNSGGDVLRWARDHLFDSEKSTAALMGINAYDLLTDIASKVPAGADGLLFHPYLGGERAPIWNANARGSFFGLTHSHTRAHMARAVFEGIIFNIHMVALALEEVVGKINSIHATGGFARSPLWRQMLADIFEQTVTLPCSIESGALAATVMAQKALGMIDNIDVISHMIGKCQEYQANPDNFEVYRELVPIFSRLSNELQKEYNAIATFQRKHVHKKKDI